MRPRLRVAQPSRPLGEHDVHLVHVANHAVDQVVYVAVHRRQTRVAETARRLAGHATQDAGTIFLLRRLGRLRATRLRRTGLRTVSIGCLAVRRWLIHILSLLIRVVTIHFRFDMFHCLTRQGLIIEVFIVLCVRLEHEMTFPTTIRFHIRFHTNHCHAR